MNGIPGGMMMPPPDENLGELRFAIQQFRGGVGLALRVVRDEDFNPTHQVDIHDERAWVSLLQDGISNFLKTTQPFKDEYASAIFSMFKVAYDQLVAQMEVLIKGGEVEVEDILTGEKRIKNRQPEPNVRLVRDYLEQNTHVVMLLKGEFPQVELPDIKDTKTKDNHDDSNKGSSSGAVPIPT